MVKNAFYLFAILWIGLINYGCDEATLVGSDLLDGEDIALNITDTFSITSYTTIGTPPFSNVRNIRYSIGNLDDPIFGKSNIEFYTTLSWVSALGSDSIGLDSAVLVFEYDTTGFYGNWENASYQAEVYLGTEIVPPSDSLFANQSIPTEIIPVAQISNKSFDHRDSLLLYDTTLDSLTLQSPQFRIKLGDEVSNRMYKSIPDITNTEELLDVYPFLKIVLTSNAGSTIGLDYSSLLSDLSGLHFYYTDTTDNVRIYEYKIGGTRQITVTHEKEGYPIEEFIDNPAVGDSLLFVQSLGGAYSVIDLSSLRTLDESLFNKVELEFTVADDPVFDTDVYEPIFFYYAYYYNEDGELTLITGDNNPNPVVNQNIFGGFLEEVTLDNGDEVQQVRMNITYHVIELLDNPDIGSEVIIVPANEVSNARRTVFYGPGHSRYPLKLNVAYTKK